MRILAIDYGDAHTGAAVSDLTGLLAGYTEVIHTRKEAEVLRRLGELIREYGVEELVLGYPKNMDGTDGKKADLYRELAARLEEAGLPARVALVNCGEGLIPHGAVGLLKQDLSLDGAGIFKKALEVLGRGQTEA